MNFSDPELHVHRKEDPDVKPLVRYRGVFKCLCGKFWNSRNVFAVEGTTCSEVEQRCFVCGTSVTPKSLELVDKQFIKTVWSRKEDPNVKRVVRYRGVFECVCGKFWNSRNIFAVQGTTCSEVEQRCFVCGTSVTPKSLELVDKQFIKTVWSCKEDPN